MECGPGQGKDFCSKPNIICYQIHWRGVMLAGGLFFSSRWEVFCAVLLQKLAQHFRYSYPHNKKIIHIKAQLGMGLERTACQFPRGITQSHLPWVQLSSHTVGIKSNLSTKVVVRNCTKTHYDLGPVTVKRCYSYLTNIYPKMTGWPAAPSKN